MRRMLFALSIAFAACSSQGAESTSLSPASAAPAATAAPTTTTPTTEAPATSAATSSSTADPQATGSPASEPTSSDDPDSEVDAGCTTITDFSASNEAWRAVNDGVMGGRSEGAPIFENATMVFSGEINTNGGGFSSVRALLAPNALAGAAAIRVVGLPDDRTYRLVLSDAAEGRDRRVSHQGDLVFSKPTAPATPDGVATVALDSLETSVFGQLVFSEPFEPALAVEIGIQIADGIDGPFELVVDRIERCPA